MNDFFEAERMKEIPFSDIRQVFEKVSQLQAQGQEPVPFHIGQPDFDTPAHIKQAAKAALDSGLTSYTSNYGLPALRQAIAAKLAHDNGVQVDPERGVIVTVGSNEAILMAMLALLNPGEEVLIPDPMWLHYLYCARLAGARVVSVPLSPANAFQLDPDDLERLVSRRTRMLVLNTPHNPTGAIFSRETIAAVARFVEKHNLVLLSDEIYEKLVYQGAQPVSPASIEAARERTITINGFSKAYAMTGWRIGYAAANRRWIDSLLRVHQYTTICATSFSQAGALAALEGPQDGLGQMRVEFARRRQVLIDGFAEIPEAELIPPQGAFYAFPSIQALGGDSALIASRLLEGQQVAVIPGRAFGQYGEGFVRLSYACSLPQVQTGMRRIAGFWRNASRERLNRKGTESAKGFA